MQLADSLKPHKQALELIFPTEDSFDCVESLGQYSRVKDWLSTTLTFLCVTLVWIDIWSHSAIENHLSVLLAVIGSIKAHYA